MGGGKVRNCVLENDIGMMISIGMISYSSVMMIKMCSVMVVGVSCMVLFCVYDVFKGDDYVG